MSRVYMTQAHPPQTGILAAVPVSQGIKGAYRRLAAQAAGAKVMVFNMSAESKDNVQEEIPT